MYMLIHFNFRRIYVFFYEHCYKHKKHNMNNAIKKRIIYLVYNPGHKGLNCTYHHALVISFSIRQY